MNVIFVSIFAALFVVWFYRRTQKPPNFPPGPPRWPVLGSLPHISNKQNNLLLGLRGLVKNFGSVVGYYVGSTPIVLVADFELLKVTKVDRKVIGSSPCAGKVFLPKCKCERYP